MFVSIVSLPKYGFTRWPLTLNVPPSLSSSSTVPNWETALTGHDTIWTFANMYLYYYYYYFYIS